METKKEIVTLNSIKIDLLKLVSHEIIANSIMVAVVCLLLSMFNLVFHLVIIKVAVIVFLLYFLYEIIFISCAAIRIWKGTYFTTRTDVLVRKSEYVPGTKWRSYKPYRLFFKHGYFDIPARTNYSWSDAFVMDEKSIFDTSFVDDSFTLIETKKKILMVYNNKFFVVEAVQDNK